MGFFELTEPVRNPMQRPGLPKCGECGLSKTCRHPKMEVIGNGSNNILIVGEAPGEDEDRAGGPFVGDSGKLLKKWCRAAGIDWKACWATNAVICHPPKNKIEDKCILACHPILVKAVKELKPDVIVPVGPSAVWSLLRVEGELADKDMKRWAGWQIPARALNAWVCPIHHPSYILRTHSVAMEKKIIQYLKAARKKVGVPRPLETEEDLKKKITLSQSPSEIAKWLRKEREVVAFDYETTNLKPEHPNQRILTCAVSTGDETIAFPVDDKRTARALSRFLQNDSKKIAANIKFEERWTRAKFGHGVNNWWWDTMLASHWMDNRVGISSVKFQAFVRYGIPDYERKVKPFASATSPQKTNHFHELPLVDLLEYNGLDALLEYKIAMDQRKEVGFDDPVQ